MKRLARLIKHLRTTASQGRRAFPAPTLKAIEAAISHGESLHRAEVRMIVEPSLNASAVWNGVSSRDRARELFAHYGIWDTEENCGVLVYVNLADHKVEIVADRGVGKAIAAKEWQAICRTMTAGFAEGKYHDAALAALGELNALLQAHYPDDGSSRNQLSNRPVLI
jgi:uncharacterized membrane protein